MNVIIKRTKLFQLALVFAGMLFLISCGGGSSTPAPTTPTPTTPTDSDHIEGTFSTSSVTQAGETKQDYVSTKITIAKSGSALNFTVASPPATSALPTGATTFVDSTKKLTVGTGTNQVVMTLSAISATGFTATFERPVAAAARGISGEWVFVFTKDS